MPHKDITGGYLKTRLDMAGHGWTLPLLYTVTKSVHNLRVCSCLHHNWIHGNPHSISFGNLGVNMWVCAQIVVPPRPMVSW